MPSRDTVRIAAVSDVHYGKTSQGTLQQLFAEVTRQADILVIPGDLTDYGFAEEARVLARDLTSTVKIPIVAVLGNHDYESGEAAAIHGILTDAGVHLLDGDSIELLGVGFAGVKGFGGGFGRGALGPWGEESIKRFVQEAVTESLKLETALARLQTTHRIAVMHYAPIRETVEGEPPEIFPWLGSSRLEEPLTRFDVSAVFHGHAHKGSPEGRTSKGIPVYNVSLMLLRERYPDRPSFRLFELPRESASPPGDEGDRRHGGRRARDRENEVTQVPSTS